MAADSKTSYAKAVGALKRKAQVGATAAAAGAGAGKALQKALAVAQSAGAVVLNKAPASGTGTGAVPVSKSQRWEGLPWNKDLEQDWPVALSRVYAAEEIPLTMQFCYRCKDRRNGHADLKSLMKDPSNFAQIDWEIKNMSLRPWKFTSFEQLARDSDTELEAKVKIWIMERKGITKPQWLLSVRRCVIIMDPCEKERTEKWIKEWLSEEKVFSENDSFLLNYYIKQAHLSTLVDIITVEEFGQRAAFRFGTFGARLLDTLHKCGIWLLDPESDDDEHALMPPAAEIVEFLHARALKKGLYMKTDLRAANNDASQEKEGPLADAARYPADSTAIYSKRESDQHKAQIRTILSELYWLQEEFETMTGILVDKEDCDKKIVIAFRDRVNSAIKSADARLEMILKQMSSRKPENAKQALVFGTELNRERKEHLVIQNQARSGTSLPEQQKARLKTIYASHFQALARVRQKFLACHALVSQVGFVHFP
jgi:hypothetical protein